jgi:5'-methylthioadenosine phosphorylase
MGRLAVCGGNSIRGVQVPEGDWTVIQRHGDNYALPHEIDHAANMRRLAGDGCDRVLAIGSVGGLRRELGPGTFVCPHDFIALSGTPSTRRDESAHVVPGFDTDWRRAILEAWSRCTQIPLADGGVYWESPGPRLETAAEIALIAERAEVVGMTIGSESVVALELGLAYAAICIVDNLANGVAETELDIPELEVARAENQRRLVAGLEAVLPELA